MTEMTVGNVRVLDSSKLSRQVFPVQRHAESGRMLFLIADAVFLDSIAPHLPAAIKPILRPNLDPRRLIQNLAAGDSMIWVGPPQGLPPG